MGWTPLLVAAVNDRVDIVRMLLKAGANPNQADEFSNINRMARDKKLHSLESKLNKLFQHSETSILEIAFQF